MLINDLNDDCLLLIFSYINDFYDQLNISQVCSRWSSLLSIRYNRKKLLLCWSSYSGPDEVEYITRAPNFIRNNITRLLPSVQLLDVNFKHHRDLTIDKLNEIGQNHLNIKGIVVQKGCIDLFLLLCFPNIEMLVCSYLLHNKNYPFDISKLRQLYIRNGSLKVLSRYGRSLNNLQRLHLYQGQHFEVYSGEIIPNLRILEYDSENDRELENDFDGFHFMDFCPSLESAYLAHRSKKCIMDSKNLNLNLRDLVILQKLENPYEECLPYSDIFAKFPNLVNLAIRNSNDIDNDDIIEFVKLLPKVKLLDFQGSPKITSKAADLLSDYCKESGRSIEIKFGGRLRNDAIWMDFNSFTENIVFELNFMDHCFNQPFEKIPILMVSRLAS